MTQRVAEQKVNGRMGFSCYGQHYTAFWGACDNAHFRGKKRCNHDTERNDFDQEEVEKKKEEVARAKEDKRQFGITTSVLLRLHFYLFLYCFLGRTCSI